MDLIAARSQMALSLGFHIIFASIGMAMPFFMAASHWLWIRRREPVYLALTKSWSKGVAVFFATGAVSGTALSFELGLLWPKFMLHAGPIIGMPFSLEGAAFFLEAIALGLFLYGWDRLPPLIHWMSGVLVGIMGLLSGGLVICANAWMNSPEGFVWKDGAAHSIDPFDAMFNAAAPTQVAHMLLAAFEATGFAVAGLHALLLLRAKDGRLREFHRAALTISLWFAAASAIIQPLSGDFAAKSVARRQPEKLAAFEAHFETERGASLLVGGIPDETTRSVRYGIRIPKMLSFLATGDFDAEVKGLEEFPEKDWPPVLITHLAFQTMVGIGTLLAGVAGLLFLMVVRGMRPLDSPGFLKLLILCTPLGFLALEAGWVVTEVGRQPWIIYHIMRTSEAVTPMPGLVYSFVMYAAIYALLSVSVIAIMWRHVLYLPKAIDHA